MEKMLVRGVTRDNNVARVAIVGVEDQPGIAFKIFSLLGKKKINIDIIIQSIGRDGTKDISFTVAEDALDEAISVLEANKEEIRYRELLTTKDVSKVSIVGAGMVNNPGIASKMFEALYEANINIHMISASEIKISVLVDQDMSEKAVKYIHDKFDFKA